MEKMIILLVLLCAMDAIFTDVGLTYETMTEQNPLMEFVYFELGPLWFYLIKVGLPLLLLLFCTKMKSKVLYGAVLVALTLYIAVLPIHLYWIAHFLNF